MAGLDLAGGVGRMGLGVLCGQVWLLPDEAVPAPLSLGLEANLEWHMGSGYEWHLLDELQEKLWALV